MLAVTRGSYGNVEIFVPTWEGASAAISRSHFRAKFESNKFARKTSKELEDKIEALWKSKSAENGRLYNAPKFRLAGCEMMQDSLELHLGLTCYKDLHGTNLSENFPSLQVKGAKDFSNKQAYMSDALGVGLLVLTSDNNMVVIRRAQWTGEHPGALDRPGGHPEPNQIFLPEGSLKPVCSNLKIEEAVEQEVWESVKKEAVDELGISESHIREVILMGVIRNMDAGGRPTLEFYTKLDMSSEQIASRYTRGLHAEADESTSIHFVPPQTLGLIPRLLQLSTYTEGTAKSSDDQEGPIKDIHIQEANWLLREGTPALRGALELAAKSRLLSFPIS